MRRSAIALLCFATTAPARALADDYPHVEVGIRSGVMVPWHDSNPALTDNMAFGLPLWLDLRLALTRHWSVGVYGAFVVGVDSAHPKYYPNGPAPEDTRAGIDVELRGMQIARVGEFWLGYGAGVERLWSGAARVSRHGVEYARGEGGFDFIDGSARGGPFVTVSYGEYLDTHDVTANFHATHSWIGGGLRLEIDILHAFR